MTASQPRPEVDRHGTGGGDGTTWLQPEDGESFTLAVAWCNPATDYQFGSRTEPRTDSDGNVLIKWNLRGVLVAGEPSTSSGALVCPGDLVGFTIRERKPEGKAYEAAKSRLRIGADNERRLLAGDLLDAEVVEAREKTAEIDGRDITWIDLIYTMDVRTDPADGEAEHVAVAVELFEWLEGEREARTVQAQAKREQEAAEAATAGPDGTGEPF